VAADACGILLRSCLRITDNLSRCCCTRPFSGRFCSPLGKPGAEQATPTAVIATATDCLKPNCLKAFSMSPPVLNEREFSIKTDSSNRL